MSNKQKLKELFLRLRQKQHNYKTNWRKREARKSLDKKLADVIAMKQVAMILRDNMGSRT
jgi:hypothetical protein